MDGIIVRRSSDIVVRQSIPMKILQRISTIHVGAVVPAFPTFIPFYAKATQGQTIFPMVSIPTAVLWISINGASQRITGDFTLSGSNIVLTKGVDADDEVFGVYI